MQSPVATTHHHAASRFGEFPQGPAFQRVTLVLAAILSVIAFCWLAQEAAIEGEYIAMEAQWIATVFTWRSPLMDQIMLGYTRTHDLFMVAFILGFMGFHAYQRHWPQVRWIVAVVPGGMLANLGLKAFFHRARPEFDSMIHAHGYSFPSGHAIAAALVAGWLIYATCLSTRSLVWRSASVALGLSIAVSVAFSRVYLGVHYPMDVIAGALAGAAWILICLALKSLLDSDATE
ncbi:phosphatase PAP2 family protein [Acidovorax sp. SUPP2522]|uniref:phosphatase PAP2 family protein n=1 Tax=unclassified Acidovorax TaxID=2684926 RepID=UPI002349F61F|nr:MULTISPECIES: phosphatase PAP2 family protein [unclassified Acidovorax]WCM96626.1 phosphatase PAP2 family protein [Acidovorax sp. GBBC 1281]GKT19277.1 phosphatase PAP2 family protein [Acidovorax sp. SUPP2522]